jgi:hypothetical protein
MPRIPRSEIRALKAAYAKGGPFASALDFAMAVLNDPDAPLEAKLRLARAVLPFQEARIEPVRLGKKETAQEASKAAARGPFAPPPLPRKPS